MAANSLSSQEPSVPAGWPGSVIPNLSDWQLGDIILVKREHTARGALIKTGQVISRSPLMRAGRDWSHAGIYVGDGQMIDAVPGTLISQRSVWAYCEHRSLALRRLPVSPHVTQAEVLGIAAAAKVYVDQPYSTLSVILDKLTPRTWPIRPGMTGRKKRLYCSTLVSLAVNDAAGVDLANLPQHRPLFPGVLYLHPNLQVIKLGWRRL